MEIVKVDLALRLQLVQKVKEMEGENSAGFRPGSRKPSNTEKLDTPVFRFLEAVFSAETILDLDLLRAGNIEKHELDRSGGDKTGTPRAMTKLVGCPQVKEGCPGKKLAIPSLEEGSISSVEVKSWMLSYLNCVEGVVNMLFEDAVFTRQAAEITVQATV